MQTETAPVPPPPQAAPPGPDEDARIARHRALLTELIDHGMDLARRLHSEAAGAQAFLATDLVERHALAARGVRHAIALDAWLARRRATAHAEAARAATTEAARNHIYLRHRVDGAITTAGGQTHPMRIRLEEYLADPGLDAEFARRPFEQIVAGICRDLGIPPPAPRLAAPLAEHPPPIRPPDPGPPPRSRPHPLTAATGSIQTIAAAGRRHVLPEPVT